MGFPGRSVPTMVTGHSSSTAPGRGPAANSAERSAARLSGEST